MNVTPLNILRLAAPGSPSLRSVARKLGVTPTSIGFFESGRHSLSPENIKKYARAVRSTPREVLKRFLLARQVHHEQQVRAVRSELRKMGVRGKKRGRAVACPD